MSENNARDQMTGKFSPGNQLQRGSDVNRRMRHLRKVLLGALTDEDIKRTLAKTLELVEEGNIAAIRVILEYGCGSPTQALELTGPDGEPLGLNVGKFTDAIVTALGEYPEARRAAALAIRGVTSACRPGTD